MNNAIAPKPLPPFIHQIGWDTFIGSRITRAPSDGCWEWNGAKGNHGYGRLEVERGRKALAHRVSWELTNGYTELCLLHKCDNRICVRPDHLFPGTRADNMRDKVRKGRQHRGENSPQHKLTEDEVRDIRQRYANRVLVNKRTAKGDPNSITAIATDYHLAVATVHELVTGKNWKDL